MEVRETVVFEDAAFFLTYSDYNVNAVCSVSWSELRSASVGDEFAPEVDGGCGRAVEDNTAKIVFKDDHGVAVLFRTSRTTDEPNPRVEQDEVCLRWFEFRD